MMYINTFTDAYTSSPPPQSPVYPTIHLRRRWIHSIQGLGERSENISLCIITGHYYMVLLSVVACHFVACHFVVRHFAIVHFVAWHLVVWQHGRRHTQLASLRHNVINVC